MSTAFLSDDERDEQVEKIITQTAITLAAAGAFNPIPLVGM